MLARLKASKAETARLRKALACDELTAAWSRRSLAERVAAAGPGPHALLHVGIDGLRGVNEGYGAAVGDALLRNVAGALAAACGPQDAVVRLGGDAFAVLARGCGPTEAAALAARLGAAVRGAAVSAAGYEIARSASIGIAPFGPGTELGAALLSAEAGARAAKSEGRDRALAAPATARRPTQEEVARGMGAGEFVYHVQPIFTLASMAPAGVEALIRWARPGHAALGPDAFIEVMTGSRDLPVAPPAAAEAVAAAFAREPGALYCAFNVPPAFLSRGDGWMRALLAGLPPERTVLEIIEDTAIERPHETRRLLGRLRAAGIRIALDDFGTGWSNFERLADYPVDIVKIDRRFIAGIEADARRRAIIAGLVGMSQALGFRIVAEGVETAPQLAALGALGVHEAQGFLLGRPGPAGTWAERLAAARAA